MPLGRLVTVDDLHHTIRNGWWRISIPDEARRLKCKSDKVALTVFRFVCEAAREKLFQPGFCLLVDEADKYGNAGTNDDNLREYARYGRHWQDSTYIITARRYAEIPKEWTAGADIVMAGTSLDPNDADAAKRLFGKLNIQTWSRLELHEFLSLTPQAVGVVRYNMARSTLEAWNLQGGNQ